MQREFMYGVRIVARWVPMVKLGAVRFICIRGRLFFKWRSAWLLGRSCLMEIDILRPEEVQAAIILFMKNQPELVSRVQLERREDDWQGTEFKYPAYRVALPDLGPYDGAMDSECRPFIFTAPFSVYCFAEGASSRDAAALAGTAVRVLVNRR